MRDDHIQELRVLGKALEVTHDVDRLRVLTRIQQLTQDLSDQELLDIASEPEGQKTMAAALGITKQAVSQRVAHARRRLEADR